MRKLDLGAFGETAPRRPRPPRRACPAVPDDRAAAAWRAQIATNGDTRRRRCHHPHAGEQSVAHLQTTASHEWRSPVIQLARCHLVSARTADQLINAMSMLPSGAPLSAGS